MYAITHNDATLDAALTLARGSYQRAILLGHEAISGGTLKGKARRYSGVYTRSSATLLRRLDAAGIPHGERRVAHGRRVVVIGIGCPTAEEASLLGS